MGGLLNIIVPILAIFLVYKLFTTLGKNGDDSQRFDQNDNRNDDTDQTNNVIKLPTAKMNKKNKTSRPDPVQILAAAMETDNYANADEQSKAGLKSIITAHPEFDYREFMNGSEVAYEMINLGFAQNDRELLQRLLTQSVFDSFNGVMDAREKAGQRVNSRFVGFERVQLTDATLVGSVVSLSVHFVAKLVSTTYDANDQIIDGDEKHVFNTNDIWTFEKDMKKRNHSWKLAATTQG